jgi:hypothetical protein
LNIRFLRKNEGQTVILNNQLRYLGTISKPEYSEYGFHIENPDKTVRLLVLTIASSVFLTRQLLVQEAPDLCYQKVLAYLRDTTADPAEDCIPISDSDIEHYRSAHPNVKAHGKAKLAL